MKQIVLLEAPVSRPSKARLLTAFKKANGILTYRTPQMLREHHPWIACVPFQEHKGQHIGIIMSHSARLYEEAGYVATGIGELSAVRTLCLNLKMSCPL